MESQEEDRSENLKRKRDNGESKSKQRNRKRKRAKVAVEENGLPSGRPTKETYKALKGRNGFGWAPNETAKEKSEKLSDTRLQQDSKTVMEARPDKLPKHRKGTHQRKLNEEKPSQDISRDLVKLASSNTVDVQTRVPSKSERKTPKKTLTYPIISINALSQDLDVVNTIDKESWVVSSPIGGRFIDARPLFSLDDKFVILATEASVHIYSTSKSLLLHSFSHKSKGPIVAYSLSRNNSEMLYLGTKSGHIECWNWVSAQHIGTWETKTEILDLSAAAFADPEDIAYTLNKSGYSWTIVAHSLGSEDGSVQPQSNLLLAHKHYISSFLVLESGKVIVAVGENSVLIGQAKVFGHGVTDLQYDWREFQCSEPINCFDVRCSSSAEMNLDSQRWAKNSIGPKSADLKLDMAIGGVRGSIYLYEDLIDQLYFANTSKKTLDITKAISPSHLHWHRQAVGSISWSRDGNYLISGGRETVLVLWQLDTGKQQFLPHLESPIEGLTVSSTGSSYAVRLGDNSVMILSTIELEPIANFAGIQCQTSVQTQRTSKMPKMKSSNEMYSDPLQRIAGANDPRKPYQLLLSVPAAQSDYNSASGYKSDPYLQTFDVLNNRHISRQAMTRTNATSTNLGPDGTTILEPSVKYLQVSSDGHWLATVDEWSPPRYDVEDLTVDNDDVQTSIDSQREISLRFWSWGESRQHWTLNSRIMMPHPCDQPQRAGKVFDLIADPRKPGFATVGEDSLVRTWRIHSIHSKDETGASGLGAKENDEVQPSQTWTWWAQELSVSVKRDSVNGHLDAVCAEMAVLAYSNDGSTIATHQNFPYSESVGGIVEFIDPTYGVIRETRSCLPKRAGSLEAMAFLERYLICVGHRGAAVVDVTTFNLVNYIELQPAAQILFDCHLAVNLATSTFAISCPEVSSNSAFAKSLAQAQSQGRSFNKLASLEDLEGRIQVYSPTSGSPLFDTLMPRPITLLLPAAGINSEINEDDILTSVDRRGYITVDCGATVRTIKPRGYYPEPIDSATKDGENPEPANRYEGQSYSESEAVAPIEHSDADMDSSSPTASNVNGVLEHAMTPTEKAVIRPEQLVELFDYPSVALPPVKSMFYSIINLYAGR